MKDDVKVNEIFELNGKKYKCIAGACRDCVAYHDIKILCSDLPRCVRSDRDDKTDVAFKEVEQVNCDKCNEKLYIYYNYCPMCGQKLKE